MTSSLTCLHPCFQQVADLFMQLCVLSVCPWGHSICFSLWIDLFVSAAFSTHHILRKSQQLAHKGPAAIPGLHLPAPSTEQHILAGLWMGAEGLQASGVWECLPPPGVALQPGVWGYRDLLSSQSQWVDKNSRQRGAGDVEMGPVYMGSCDCRAFGATKVTVVTKRQIHTLLVEGSQPLWWWGVPFLSFGSLLAPLH